MSLQLLKEIIFQERQDSHITLFTMHKDEKLYEDIREYDENEARRLGKR